MSSSSSASVDRDPGRQAIVKAPGCVAAGPYSLAVQTGGIVFTSGQIGLDPDTCALVEGGFDAQVTQIFKNFASLFDAAGLSFANVVKCTVFLTDVDTFAQLNELYRIHFPTPFPARTTIGVADLPLGALVEIEMIVHRP